ncbi:MAG: radical SAM protein [bacterium]
MKIIGKTEKRDIATVFIAEMEDGRRIEFAESVQPPFGLEKKWVLTVSTLYGCPVGCLFCDAGIHYQGRLSRKDILAQIDYLVRRRFPDGRVAVEKFKIQFARMGEPAFNQNVLDILTELSGLYDAPGLLPSLSTIAPEGCDRFFERLLQIKNEFFAGNFQLQFSIHSTDRRLRDWLIPVKKWNFDQMAEYGEAFYRKGERRITLNFALADGMPVLPDVLLRHFRPDIFLIKITPVNPTYQVRRRGMTSYILPGREDYEISDALREAGYDVILSIGELEENRIGSNCGQLVMSHLKENEWIRDAYTYPLVEA